MAHVFAWDKSEGWRPDGVERLIRKVCRLEEYDNVLAAHTASRRILARLPPDSRARRLIKNVIPVPYFPIRLYGKTEFRDACTWAKTGYDMERAGSILPSWQEDEEDATEDDGDDELKNALLSMELADILKRLMQNRVEVFFENLKPTGLTNYAFELSQRYEFKKPEAVPYQVPVALFLKSDKRFVDVFFRLTAGLIAAAIANVDLGDNYIRNMVFVFDPLELYSATCADELLPSTVVGVVDFGITSRSGSALTRYRDVDHDLARFGMTKAKTYINELLIATGPGIPDDRRSYLNKLCGKLISDNLNTGTSDEYDNSTKMQVAELYELCTAARQVLAESGVIDEDCEMNMDEMAYWGPSVILQQQWDLIKDSPSPSPNIPSPWERAPMMSPHPTPNPWGGRRTDYPGIAGQ